MDNPIAKQLLIRWADSESTLQQYRPAVREFVYAMDTGAVFMGTAEGAKKLSYWVDVIKYVQDNVKEYKPKQGNNEQLAVSLQPGQIAYNTTNNRLQYLDPITNIKQTYVTTLDLIAKDPITIKITKDNINTNDSNSVTFANFKRTNRLIFVNGTHINTLESKTPYYKYSTANKELKIYNMSDGDIVSYY